MTLLRKITILFGVIFLAFFLFYPRKIVLDPEPGCVLRGRDAQVQSFCPRKYGMGIPIATKKFWMLGEGRARGADHSDPVLAEANRNYSYIGFTLLGIPLLLTIVDIFTSKNKKQES